MGPCPVDFGFDAAEEIRGQDPTMPSAFLIFIALVAMSIVLPIVVRLVGGGPRKKAKRVIEYAQRKGYALVNPDVAQAVDSSLLEKMKNPALRQSKGAHADIADIEGLAGGTGDWLAFTCNLGSKQATIFNLSVTSGGTSGAGGNVQYSGANYHYKVAKIKAAGLPVFSVRRESIVHSVENVVDKIVGKPDLTIAVDARQFPEFAAHWWLKGEDQGAVMKFLSGDKMRFLETEKLKGVLATNASYLVYFEPGKLESDKDFDLFIGEVEKIAAVML